MEFPPVVEPRPVSGKDWPLEGPDERGMAPGWTAGDDPGEPEGAGPDGPEGAPPGAPPPGEPAGAAWPKAGEVANTAMAPIAAAVTLAK
jgi:hypothetical protein